MRYRGRDDAACMTMHASRWHPGPPTHFPLHACARRAGFVTIIGRPNAGKSTLMNAILGQALSIVTPKAQTTRHRILGILSEPDFQVCLGVGGGDGWMGCSCTRCLPPWPHSAPVRYPCSPLLLTDTIPPPERPHPPPPPPTYTHQAVFLDTPGIIEARRSELEERMMAAVQQAVKDADCLLAIVDASWQPQEALAMIQPGEDWKGPPMAVVRMASCVCAVLRVTSANGRSFESQASLPDSPSSSCPSPPRAHTMLDYATTRS